MQSELARLSSDHAHVLALRSDHIVHGDRPDFVARAIRAVRDDAELPPSERLFTGADGRCLS
jgi:hypothetical protein